ncbi:MAG: Flp family type IVb pilin [Sphingomonas sp.]|nr:Flp family type IVb pilin [Sphingomonas sp.]
MRECTGATAIEYGLILALVALALLVGLTALGSGNGGLWSAVESKVVNATQPEGA